MAERVRFHAIKVNGQTLQKAQDAIIVGYSGSENVNLNILGNPSLDQALELLNTAQLQILEEFHILATQDIQDPERCEKIREEIWGRANIFAGMMLDKFHPEGKKSKFGGLTDEAILKAQNEILSHRQK